jgi:hypothetical protein
MAAKENLWDLCDILLLETNYEKLGENYEGHTDLTDLTDDFSGHGCKGKSVGSVRSV